MRSAEIRQSFLDFFKSKDHTIVPSSSLMPDSPNLLFTNAGMNQFVPIFLGQRPCPYSPPRAADTQKCVRAGGKHNDLEEVGLDTYHHTFFEMLGNWSFGDYFKSEAIQWAWELVTEVWRVPRERLYATVYRPDRSKGDPAEFDEEAYGHWAGLFSAAGFDPRRHIILGEKKDNFWMMGDTGPCGPCSELHVDLTQQGDTQGALVNAGSSECIEIWNLVFIQFNAHADGSLAPLPARHVDTGMGLERVASLIQNTSNFARFGTTISNYETDVFRPLFRRLEEISGKRYRSTLPRSGTAGATEQEEIDVAFRVIADHIRTVGFAIADGIDPGNTDRQYVIRRLLRRAVRYGRTLGFRRPFFFQLVGVLGEGMGEVFPEIRSKQERVEDVVRREEEAFNRTLDRGIEIFNRALDRLPREGRLEGEVAFKLYDTYGFPVDLTELMARENQLTVDRERFDVLMEAQRARARAAQKKEVVSVSDVASAAATEFVGYQMPRNQANVVQLLEYRGKTAVILDRSSFYAEMGGQVGDTGRLEAGDKLWEVEDVRRAGHAFVHILRGEVSDLQTGMEVSVVVDEARRQEIQRHHTVTHLFHWALHEIVSRQATQKGSYVGPDKLTFDFNSTPLSEGQIGDVERLVNERILENQTVSCVEVPFQSVSRRAEIMQIFGEKYDRIVRVVQIGGSPGNLDGYSMELCGGTHTRSTGEIGLFRIMGEGAVAAGIRRVVAVAGMRAYETALKDSRRIQSWAVRLNSPVAEVEKKLDALLCQQKEMEKRLRAMQTQQASQLAQRLARKARTVSYSEDAGTVRIIAGNLGEVGSQVIQATAEALKRDFEGVVVLGGSSGLSVSLLATVSAKLSKTIPAGKVIQAIAPIVGGRGGGKPEFARGGGKDPSRLDEALAAVESAIGKLVKGSPRADRLANGTAHGKP